MKKLILVVLLVVAGCTVQMTPDKLVRAEKERVLAEVVERIRQLDIARQEQQLMKDIMQLRYEQLVLKSKMRPAPQPVVQNVPPETKE